ncbi:DUF4832 domain-containing protein [Archangium minus]
MSLPPLRALALTLSVALATATSAPAASGAWEGQTYNGNAPGLESNPLKGFVPFGAATHGFPHSMEWYYLPLNSLMTGGNSSSGTYAYNWAELDSAMAAAASRGNQIVFRIYLDYPGRAVATPQFLINEGLPMRSYSDYGNSSSKAPDWNNGNLIKALEAFIGALGQHLDGDARVAYVTAGLYGYWGEWHTYPQDADTSDGKPNWEMSQANKDRLLARYKSAFTRTHVLVRDPLASSTYKNDFGYHDDSFAYETLPGVSWHFWSKMQSAGLTENWRRRPMGGEQRPEMQPTMWNSWPNPVEYYYGTPTENEETAIKTTHATWLINNWLFNNAVNSTQWNNALRAQKLLGYELFVSSVRLPNPTTSTPLSVDINLENRGVAPFYYDWKLEFIVLNASNTWLKTLGTTQVNLPGLQPGSAASTKSFSASHGLSAGTGYKLLMRVVNPMTNGKPVSFANAKQGQDWGGWLTLGSFDVTK